MSTVETVDCPQCNGEGGLVPWPADLVAVSCDLSEGAGAVSVAVAEEQVSQED